MRTTYGAMIGINVTSHFDNFKQAKEASIRAGYGWVFEYRERDGDGVKPFVRILVAEHYRELGKREWTREVIALDDEDAATVGGKS